MPSVHEQTANAAATPILNWGHGVSVTLKRAANETSAFTARRSIKTEVIGDNINIPMTVEYRTYFFAASELDAYAWIDRPQKGDVIVEGSEEFRVVKPPSGPAVEPLPGSYEFEVVTERVV